MHSSLGWQLAAPLVIRDLVSPKRRGGVLLLLLFPFPKDLIANDLLTMKPTAIASVILSATAATAAAVVPTSGPEHRIPTSYESAVLGRRILALTPIGTLSTVFPEDKQAAAENAIGAEERRPAGLGGMPYGLMVRQFGLILPFCGYLLLPRYAPCSRTAPDAPDISYWGMNS